MIPTPLWSSYFIGSSHIRNIFCSAYDLIDKHISLPKWNIVRYQRIPLCEFEALYAYIPINPTKTGIVGAHTAFILVHTRSFSHVMMDGKRFMHRSVPTVNYKHTKIKNMTNCTVSVMQNYRYSPFFCIRIYSKSRTFQTATLNQYIVSCINV